MKNVLYGALCSAMVFAALLWGMARKPVHAAVLTSPPEGRFQLVQLHPSAGTEWSGILDTETGCTWVFTTNNPDDPKITDQSYKLYLDVLGGNSFDLVNFNPNDYTAPTLKSDNTLDRGPYMREIGRVQAECSQARLTALRAASAH
jgi:hypothetical protein